MANKLYMKKVLFILTILLLVISCNQQSKHVVRGQKVVEKDSITKTQHFSLIPEGLEEKNEWDYLLLRLNEQGDKNVKDSILIRMNEIKFRLSLEDKFDSIVWSFLQDERTFYYSYKPQKYGWHVSMSEDKKVKMYSYDQGGGTARYGRTILQYIDGHGHIRLKEIKYDEPECGTIITPIYKKISRTKDGYTLYGGTQISSQEYYESCDFIHDTCFVGGLKDGYENEHFTIIYRKPINGYKVKALAKLAVSDVDIIAADITFTKEGKSFTLHTECYGDTVFCKGRLDYKFENPVLFKKFRYKTIEADYYEYKEDGELMPMYTPFFFRDLDFDGVEELVIVHYSMAVRFHDGYDVYRIVDGEPVLIDYPPYRHKDDVRMTDYPEFNYKNKTISCPYPEGPGGLGFDGCTIYGISKRQKDTININGKKYYFNHMDVIKEIKYEDE